MSQLKKEETGEISVTGKVDIDYPSKSNIMTVKNEAFTSKNELIKNRRENPSLESSYRWLDSSILVEKMVDKISHWPLLYKKDLPEITIADLFKEVEVTVQVGYALFQIFEFCDHKEQWSEDMLQYGIVFPREYVGYDPAWNLKITYRSTQVSSHGHEFFLEFFKLTKGWFDEEGTITISSN